VTNHISAVDGRSAFEQEEEQAILLVLREKMAWPCAPEHSSIGALGFRSDGWHEKKERGTVPAERKKKTQPSASPNVTYKKLKLISTPSSNSSLDTTSTHDWDEWDEALPETLLESLPEWDEAPLPEWDDVIANIGTGLPSTDFLEPFLDDPWCASSPTISPAQTLVEQLTSFMHAQPSGFTDAVWKQIFYALAANFYPQTPSDKIKEATRAQELCETEPAMAHEFVFVESILGATFERRFLAENDTSMAIFGKLTGTFGGKLLQSYDVSNVLSAVLGAMNAPGEVFEIRAALLCMQGNVSLFDLTCRADPDSGLMVFKGHFSV
jgi:hypothetical protein